MTLISDKAKLLKEDLVLKQIKAETSKEKRLAKEFQEAANEWWEEYKQLRASHKKRLVPIFADTDDRTTLYLAITVVHTDP